MQFDRTKTPAHLGLPAKFSLWREGQLSAVMEIVNGQGTIPMNLPTGTGKSLIYMAAAKLLGGRTVFLTSTKALQDQLMRDFQQVGLLKIMGKVNYPCLKSSWLLDNDALCSILHCDLSQMCPYHIALRAARRTTLLVTNYAYFLAQSDLGTWDTIVCDEAHLLPSVLEGHFSTTVNYPFVAKVLGLPKTVPCNWPAWVEDHFHLLNQAIQAAVNAKDEKRAASLLPVVRQLDKLPTILDGHHVVKDEGNDRFSFKAVMPSGAWLADLAKRFVLVSATMTDKILEQVKIPGETRYFKSPFPPAQQPVYVAPIVRVNKSISVPDTLKLVGAIDRIIGARLDRKGIVHVSSYQWAQDIVEQSWRKMLFWTHTSKDLNTVVEAFRRAKPPAVLISPSLSTGYDFPYEDCTYQVVAKVPFPDLGDPVMIARKEVDEEAYVNEAIQKLVQSCGRGMRAENDYCETFILDSVFWWVFTKHKHLFPAWFKKCLVKTQDIPDPIPMEYLPFRAA